MNCGHIAQLAQSISQLLLKPGEEEIKKKRMMVILEMIYFYSRFV
jgi:ribonucleotide reductase beta subunit family protein with ferritin-like domain